MAHVQMLCHLLECLLIPANLPNDCPKEVHELYFVFSCVWAFGSAMFQDTAIDYRVEFSKWWVNEFKSVKFPTGGLVFDYFIDTETKQFSNWSKEVHFSFVSEPLFYIFIFVSSRKSFKV